MSKLLRCRILRMYVGRGKPEEKVRFEIPGKFQRLPTRSENDRKTHQTAISRYLLDQEYIRKMDEL